jgi:hypothetical protein
MTIQTRGGSKSVNFISEHTSRAIHQCEYWSRHLDLNAVGYALSKLASLTTQALKAEQWLNEHEVSQEVEWTIVEGKTRLWVLAYTLVDLLRKKHPEVLAKVGGIVAIVEARGQLKLHSLWGYDYHGNIHSLECAREWLYSEAVKAGSSKARAWVDTLRNFYLDTDSTFDRVAFDAYYGAHLMSWQIVKRFQSALERLTVVNPHADCPACKAKAEYEAAHTYVDDQIGDVMADCGY